MHHYKDKEKPHPVRPRRAVHTYGVPHLVLLLFLILVSFPDLWRHSLRALHGHATTSSRFCFRRHLTTPAQLQANVDHLMVPTDPRAPGLDLRSSHTFKHALVNRQCPRYVMALQNENAGVGHTPPPQVREAYQDQHQQDHQVRHAVRVHRSTGRQR